MIKIKKRNVLILIIIIAATIFSAIYFSPSHSPIHSPGHSPSHSPGHSPNDVNSTSNAPFLYLHDTSYQGLVSDFDTVYKDDGSNELVLGFAPIVDFKSTLYKQNNFVRALSYEINSGHYKYFIFSSVFSQYTTQNDYSAMLNNFEYVLKILQLVQDSTNKLITPRFLMDIETNVAANNDYLNALCNDIKLIVGSDDSLYQRSIFNFTLTSQGPDKATYASSHIYWRAFNVLNIIKNNDLIEGTDKDDYKKNIEFTFIIHDSGTNAMDIYKTFLFNANKYADYFNLDRYYIITHMSSICNFYNNGIDSLKEQGDLFSKIGLERISSFAANYDSKYWLSYITKGFVKFDKESLLHAYDLRIA